MKYKELSQTEKHELVGIDCILDGEMARIYGRLNKVATVTQVDGPLALEWSWETAKKIIDNDGKFSS